MKHIYFKVGIITCVVLIIIFSSCESFDTSNETYTVEVYPITRSWIQERNLKTPANGTYFFWNKDRGQHTYNLMKNQDEMTPVQTFPMTSLNSIRDLMKSYINVTNVETSYRKDGLEVFLGKKEDGGRDDYIILVVKAE